MGGMQLYKYNNRLNCDNVVIVPNFNEDNSCSTERNCKLDQRFCLIVVEKPKSTGLLSFDENRNSNSMF